MTLTTDQIEEFLVKLNDDEEFRNNLKNNPLEVLNAYGIDTSTVEVPSEVKLPSVGEVNENRDAFKEALFPDNEVARLEPDFTLSGPAD